MSASSFTQYMCRSRWCMPQITCGAPVVRHSFSFWKDSVVFFRARFGIGVSPSQFFRHTAHVFACLCFQLASRHSLQKLWPHDSSKGSRKSSLHTGQLRSDSRRDGLSVISSSIAKAPLMTHKLLTAFPSFTFFWLLVTVSGHVYTFPTYITTFPGLLWISKAKKYTSFCFSNFLFSINIPYFPVRSYPNCLLCPSMRIRVSFL